MKSVKRPTASWAMAIFLGFVLSLTGLSAATAEGSGTISGVVTIPAGATGRVEVTSESTTYGVNVSESGPFSLDIPSGEYTLRFWSSSSNVVPATYHPGTTDVLQATTFSIGDGTVITDADFVAIPATTVSGTVTFPAGESSTISLRTADNVAVASAFPQPDGSYDFGQVPDGTYIVYSFPTTGVLGTFYPGTTVRDLAETVVVAGSVPVTGIDFAAVPASSITGSITSVTNGYVELQVYDAGGALVSTTWVEITAGTGTYSLDGLLEGAYYVAFERSSKSTSLAAEFYDDSPEDLGFDAATPIALGTGVTHTSDPVSIVLGGTATGTVLDSTGNPVGGARVVAFTPDGSLSSRSTDTAADGTFTIRGLASGAYYVAANDTVLGELFYGNVLSIAESTPVSMELGANVDVGLLQYPGEPGTVVSSLVLEPKAESLLVGEQGCVTATLTDAGGVPVPAVDVTFSVSGANTASIPVLADASGLAEFCYAGAAEGTDTITASAQSQTDIATKTWTTSGPPTASAGGPYTGLEGSDIPIVGEATDPEADLLTTTWSVVAGPAADAGATCTVADPDSLGTTVRCTDDGTYVLTLSVSDGINPAVTSTADLTVTNAAPSVTITSPSEFASFPVDAVVDVTAAYTEVGSNDVISYSVDFGDMSAPVTGTAAAGEITASHTFTAPGSYLITVTVTDDDGATGSTSRVITVSNTAPVAGSVEITPETMGAGTQTFTATPTGFTDPDGDTLTYQYTWTVNDTPAGTDSPTLTTDVTPGDIITVAVTATDGTATTTPVTDTLTVQISDGEDGTTEDGTTEDGTTEDGTTDYGDAADSQSEDELASTGLDIGTGLITALTALMGGIATLASRRRVAS